MVIYWLQKIYLKKDVGKGSREGKKETETKRPSCYKDVLESVTEKHKSNREQYSRLWITQIYIELRMFCSS